MSFWSSPLAAQLLAEELAALRKIRWLLFAFGLLSVVIGMVAIGHAFLATITSVIFLGVLLLMAGGASVAQAFLTSGSRGFGLQLLAAALYLILGYYMVRDPLVAAKVLTILITACLLGGGLLRLIFSSAVRFPGWPWVALTGVIDLILGSLIWAEWPESALWVIGLFVGIDLLFQGWSSIILALSLAAIPARTEA